METLGGKSYSNNFFLEGGDISRLAYQTKNDPEISTVVLPQSLDGANSYKRESFTDNNKRINDLHDEIIELKQKLKQIYEKDDKIRHLKSEIEIYKNKEKKNTLLMKALLKLKKENKALQDNYDEAKLEIINSENIKLENKLLKERFKDENIDEIISTEINIDIDNLKKVLNDRLQNYHDKHINEIIMTHGLNKKKTIDKKLMEKILEEAIHI